MNIYEEKDDANENAQQSKNSHEKDKKHIDKMDVIVYSTLGTILLCFLLLFVKIGTSNQLSFIIIIFFIAAIVSGMWLYKTFKNDEQ